MFHVKTSAHAPRRICDYEGSQYRREFWEEAERSFEDAAERLALRALLPPRGSRILDIGAGFGRLVGEYSGYDEIILLDYAESMLHQAREIHGDRLRYVCADLYRLPFATSALDTVIQIRVLHHVEDIASAIGEVARSLRAGGSYVLEFANKRNAKAILRYAAGEQDESPYSEAPWEFVPLNWNFHPRHVESVLSAAGLAVRERRAVSHFRHPRLKSVLPAQTLATLDAAIGRPLARLALAPSQFVRAAKLTGHGLSPALWRCPDCGHEPLVEEADGVPCTACGRVWPIRDGVYRFR